MLSATSLRNFSGQSGTSALLSDFLEPLNASGATQLRENFEMPDAASESGRIDPRGGRSRRPRSLALCLVCDACCFVGESSWSHVVQELSLLTLS